MKVFLPRNKIRILGEHFDKDVHLCSVHPWIAKVVKKLRLEVPMILLDATDVINLIENI